VVLSRDFVRCGGRIAILLNVTRWIGRHVAAPPDFRQKLGNVDDVRHPTYATSKCRESSALFVVFNYN